MNVRLAVFRNLLAPMNPGHLLDLGTGHGSFARVARELGWDVTAVDARSDRMPKTPGIDWIEQDVRTFDVGGYDCIALLGLLYHLELEDQLDLLDRCAPTPTILDTHVALEPDTRSGGYRGRSFGEDTTALTASWGNRTSFWPTEESLLRMLYGAGYGAVYRHTPPYRVDRTFWLCLPPSGDREPTPWREWLDHENPSRGIRIHRRVTTGLRRVWNRLTAPR